MSDTPESSLQRFGRMSREFIVIVIGVFVALAAESWWSEREDRQLERDLRLDMITEFEANVTTLENDIARNLELTAQVRTLIASEADSIATLPDAALIERLEQIYLVAGFDPELGAAQALVDSGNIIAIADRDLRLRMTRWSGLLATDKRFSLQIASYALQSLVPAIATASSDGTLSSEERETLRQLLRTKLLLHDIIVESQRRLLGTAQDLHAYLESTQ